MNTSQNWVHEKEVEKWHKKAVALVKEHDEFEKSKQIIHNPHPTAVRCEIIIYK